MEQRFPCGDLIHSGYVFERELGTGLFGTCYLCKNQMGQPVVLKRYEPVSFQINQGKNHYEASILSSLSHPAIPELFGVLHTSGSMYLILEYRPGSTLNTDLFQNHKVYSDFEISRVGAQLLSVVEYLHTRNIVHRDISIDNIIDDGIYISLVDFGLSRAIRYEESSVQTDYYCFGEVLLFLLYSRHMKTGSQNDSAAPWHEELKLTNSQKYFIGRLLRLEKPFAGVTEMSNGFIGFMEEGLPAHL